MPTISVIVPVYNVEKYLNRCVDSILNQTFTDFELILVDDGSTDNSGKICDEYAKKDSRVRVIHKENGGVSSARNVGLDNAVGEYIMFCDSDDYVANDWCEEMHKAILHHPKALIVSNISRHERKIDFTCDIEKTTRYVTKEYMQIYLMGLSAYIVNKIYSLEIIMNNNLRFDEECNFSEDIKFNIVYFGLCDEIVYIDTILCFYIQNESSIMHKYYPNLFALNLPAFWLRLPVIGEDNVGEFCDIYLYYFINLFDNVFDERNNMSFIEKMRYNQKMIKTKEIRFCIDNCTGQKESDLFMKIIRKRNYYLLFIFQKLTKIKKSLRRGN